MNDLVVPLCLALGVLIVALRFTFAGHGLSWVGSYEALAHVWVGAVAAIAWYESSPLLWWFWGGAAVFELVMFLIRKRRGAVT